MGQGRNCLRQPIRRGQRTGPMVSPRILPAGGPALLLVLLAAVALVTLTFAACSSPSDPQPAPISSATPEPGSTEVLDYFLEVALGVEYGSSSPVVLKWSRDPTIQVHGSPTADDLDTLSRVIFELNELVGGVRLELVQEEATIDVYFEPESRFASILPEYISGNKGFFWTWWDGPEIVRAKILIASDQAVPQVARSHLIREELTQALGLMKDSSRYPESIFYGGWTTVTEYAEIDREVIRILYLDSVTAGMTRDQVMSLLSTN